MRSSLICAVAGALVLAGISPVAAAQQPTPPLRAHQWGLDLIGADPAHQTTAGGGAVVAVVDTGVQTEHADLQGQLVAGYDFVNNTASMHDGNGHGSHVAGIVVGSEIGGVGTEGVAPRAKVMPVRVLGDDGSGDDATVAKGINYAVDHGAQVINLSLGGLPISSVGAEAFAEAINRALDRGVAVVGSAGNDTFPACEQPDTNGRLLCVGAVDRRGQPSFYSSFGAGVNVFAPGGSTLPGPDEDVLSTFNDGGYHYLAGTSQAAPHVAGVAALLVSLGLRGDALRQRVLSTEQASGIVDARAAVAGLSRSASPAPEPARSGAPRGTSGVPHRARPHRGKRHRGHRRRRHLHHRHHHRHGARHP